MIRKFLNFDKIYNFCFNEKIVTPKNLPLQAFVITTLENSLGRSTLAIWEWQRQSLLLLYKRKKHKNIVKPCIRPHDSNDKIFCNNKFQIQNSMNFKTDLFLNLS